MRERLQVLASSNKIKVWLHDDKNVPDYENQLSEAGAPRGRIVRLSPLVAKSKG
jgi:hypothetical protein